jgi:uncharacterized protein DUF3892
MTAIVSEFSPAEVTATVRSPDGQSSGVIVGLIVVQGGQTLKIDKATAIRMAARTLLWSHVPGDGRQVKVIPVDEDGDRIYDYVRTEADGYYGNNLLALPIWSTSMSRYISPTSIGSLGQLFGGR